MPNQTIYDLHKNYVNSGVSLIQESHGLENKELLQELLTELSQEYVKTVFGTVEKVKISPEEAKDRDLLSSEQLKQKFFEDIAKETNIEVKVKNARQLVDALFSENQEAPIEDDEDILKPRILGTVENIGTIILPPDLLERVIGLGRGRDQRETPVGFDKIGMVEERLSTTLGRERSTFNWKIGTLNDNQMRKVSYYHLYLPEFDKTLLLNNQYGEGAFVVNGKFNIREARKSDLKGSSESVMVPFNYEHPEEFIERLWQYISGSAFTTKNILATSMELDKSHIINFFKGNPLDYWKNLTSIARANIKVQNCGLGKIAKIYNVDGSPVNNREVRYSLLEKISGEKIERSSKEQIKAELDQEFRKYTLEYWKSVRVTERRTLKINNYGLIAIASLYGEKKDPTVDQDARYDLLEKIFGEKIERISREQIKKNIKIFFQEKSLEEWKSMVASKRQVFKLYGYGMKAIGGLFDLKSNPQDNQNAWYDLLEKIFDVVIPREKTGELTKEMIMQEFKNKPLEYWKGLLAKERLNIKINGYGVSTIGSKYGIIGDPLGYQNAWYDLLEKIFDVVIPRGKTGELTKEMIMQEFKNQPISYWLALSNKQKKEFKINGYGLRSICTKLGAQIDARDSWNLWRDLIEYIFEEKIDRSNMPNLPKKQLEKEGKLTKALIENYFVSQDIEILKKMPAIDRANIKINGYGLKAITSMYGITDNAVSNLDVRYSFLEKVFNIILPREKKSSLEKDTVETFFKTQSIEKRKELSQKDCRNLKIDGYGLIAIARLYGMTGSPIRNKYDLHSLLELIFNKPLEGKRELLTKEKVDMFFKDYSIDERKKLNHPKRQSLKVAGYGLTAVARLYGIDGDPIGYWKIRHKLLEKIFGIHTNNIPTA